MDAQQLRALQKAVRTRLCRPGAHRVRRARGVGHEGPVVGRARGLGPLHHLRCEPAGVDLHGHRRPGAGAGARPRSTCCPRTCARSRPMCSATGSSFPTRRSATTWTSQHVIDAVLARSRSPKSCCASACRSCCAGHERLVDAAPLLTPERVLRRLEWQVVRRLDGRLQGDYRTLLRGNGTDFLDLRAYEWGDDVRHIDWNVTARMDELFVREFMEERELTAWLLLDRSRSMAFGAVERTKERVLCELAATFGQLLVRGGNRVGAIVYDGEPLWTIPPRQGRNQVLALVPRAAAPGARGLGDRPQQAARHRRATRAPPVARRADLGLHQRARMGAAAAAPHRTARGRRRPAGGSPRVRAPRCRAVVRAGRGDGRTVARRFERSRAPPPPRWPWPRSRTRPSGTASPGRGSTSTWCRPRTIS